MPVPFLKSLSKETGKSMSELEKLWGEAKKLASEHFNKPESKFGDKEFAYVIGIIKKMVKNVKEGHYEILDYGLKAPVSEWNFALDYNGRRWERFDDIDSLKAQLKYYGLPDSLAIFNVNMFDKEKCYIKNSYRSSDAYAYPPVKYGRWIEDCENTDIETLTVTEDVKIPGTDLIIKKGESFEFSKKYESGDFMANRRLLQKFAVGVDWVFDRQGKTCGINVDHRFSRAIAGNSEYIVDCIATSEDLFNAFEKEYLNPYCRGFRDVTYTYEDRRLRTGLHRIYTFSEGKWTEDIDSQNSIVINEECRIPGTDIVLEAGDMIVCQEAYLDYGSFIGETDLEKFALAAKSCGVTGASYDNKKRNLYLYKDNSQAAITQMILYYDPNARCFIEICFGTPWGTKGFGQFKTPVPIDSYLDDKSNFIKGMSACVEALDKINEQYAIRNDIYEKLQEVKWALKYPDYNKTGLDPSALNQKFIELSKQINDLDNKVKDKIVFARPYLSGTMFKI